MIKCYRGQKERERYSNTVGFEHIRIDTSRTTGSSALHSQCIGTGGRVVSGRAGMREEGGGGVKGA